MSRRFRLLVVLCLAVNAGLVSYKLWGLHWWQAIVTDGSRWDVEIEARGSFPADASPQLRLALADKSTGQIEDERFQHAGWSMSLRSRRDDRYARLTRAPGETSPTQGITYRFAVRPHSAALASHPPTEADLSEALSPSERIPSDDAGVRQQAASLAAHAKDEEAKARALFDFVQDEVVSAPTSDSRSGALQALQQRAGDDESRARLFVALSRSVGIPTRLVHTVALIEGSSRPVHLRAEALLHQRWVPIDPVRDLFDHIPAEELVLLRGDESIVTSDNAAPFEVHVTTTKESSLASAIQGRIRSGRAHWTDRWSPLAFPFHTQLVLRLLLLLPLGALVISIGRNLLGVPTFGTFAPLLLALAFHETPLLASALLLLSVLLVGLVARVFVDRLRLLLVPRLSLLLTVVVGIVVTLHFALLRWNGEQVFSVALLPMVIFTMTIERLSLMIGEEGWRATLKTLAGTALITAACYLVVRSTLLQQCFLLFPETNLTVAAGLLLMGRYTGYRVSELLRFQSLAKEDPRPATEPEP